MREAFDAVAPQYDLVSSVMTLGMGNRWRRAAAEAADVSACSHVLDVFTGTGDVALMLTDRVASEGEVIGVDFSPAMIDRARIKAAARGRRCRFEVADALQLPFEDGRFDAVTASGGLRGLDDPAAAVREMVRVAAPGARIVVLEITPPHHLRGLHEKVLAFAMPKVGGLLGGDPDAFGELGRSIAHVPPAVEVAAMMSACGVSDIRWREFSGGVATLHRGRVAA